MDSLKNNTPIGALEIVLMLDELHKRGYEKLRLCPSMSPSGLCWRSVITYKENVDTETGAIALDNEAVWRYSCGDQTTGVDYKQLASDFIKDNQNLFKLGTGQDKNYLIWYQQVVELAKIYFFPICMGDYMEDIRTLGHIPCIGDHQDTHILPFAPY